MATAIITFNLNDPEDVIRWKLAAHADDMASVLFEFQHNFMRKLENQLNTGRDAYDVVRELLSETLAPINEISETIIQ